MKPVKLTVRKQLFTVDVYTKQVPSFKYGGWEKEFFVRVEGTLN